MMTLKTNVFVQLAGAAFVCVSLFPINTFARDHTTIWDGFGMQMFIDGKATPQFDYWNLNCGKGDKQFPRSCLLRKVQLNCGEYSFFADTQMFSTKDSTLKILGGWVNDGVLTISRNDGSSEEFLCRFYIDQNSKVKNAECSKQDGGQTVSYKMPEKGFRLDEKCKGLEFHGKLK